MITIHQNASVPTALNCLPMDMDFLAVTSVSRWKDSSVTLSRVK